MPYIPIVIAIAFIVTALSTTDGLPPPPPSFFFPEDEERTNDLDRVSVVPSINRVTVVNSKPCCQCG